MKRMKRRIILGTTAVAAALTIGGCSGARLEDAGTAATVQESGSETGNEQNAGETILPISTGMIISQTTSPIMHIGVIIEGNLNSPTFFKSVLSIVEPLYYRST